VNYSSRLWGRPRTFGFVRAEIFSMNGCLSFYGSILFSLAFATVPLALAFSKLLYG
jgi:hypothetical protein